MATVNIGQETMTTAEAAKYMGLALDTVRQYVHRGLISTTKFGNLHVITKAECDRYLREKRGPGNPHLIAAAKKSKKYS